MASLFWLAVSPSRAAFERRLNNRRNIKMNFSDALNELKAGHRVCRSGWNGKSMFLFLVPNWTYTDGKQDNYPNLPFVAMKTADEKVVPWLCSQTDMLADDWEVLSN